jgi:hypothetical protein
MNEGFRRNHLLGSAVDDSQPPYNELPRSFHVFRRLRGITQETLQGLLTARPTHPRLFIQIVSTTVSELRTGVSKERHKQLEY